MKIALVGKYVELPDAYISVTEALKHAGYASDAEVDINWVNANDVTDENVAELVGDAAGIIVPGGFGQRGTEGKIAAIKYARENDVPMLGICLGMQLTAVEFARNVLGLEGAHSFELDPETKYPVIDIMRDQVDVEDMGGTLRLGLYPAKLKNGSRAKAAYNDAEVVQRRHRHRYEFNNKYREDFEKLVSYSQEFRQITVWLKSLNFQAKNSSLLVNITQSYNHVQTVQKNSTQNLFV